MDWALRMLGPVHPMRAAKGTGMAAGKRKRFGHCYIVAESE